MGLSRERLIIVAQKHSAEFHIIKGALDQWDPHTPGDAMATIESGAALAVGVADCFPVLIAEPKSGAIAAVHAGWRGTLGRILRRTLEGMKCDLGADLSCALVALGPGIRRCCLEVGPEVHSAFATEFPGAPCARRTGNMPESSCLICPRLSTSSLRKPEFRRPTYLTVPSARAVIRSSSFSYRAEGVRTGRMMGVICKTE